MLRENRRTSFQVGPLLKIIPKTKGPIGVTPNSQFMEKQGGGGNGLGSWVGCSGAEEAQEKGPEGCVF